MTESTGPTGSTGAEVRIEPGAVVAGVDGTATAVRAAAWAAAEARVRGTALFVLHAAPYATDPQGRRRASGIVGHACSVARRAAPGVEVHGVRSALAPLPALQEASERADLLVVGMITGDTPAEPVLGSLTPAISEVARCPLVVVRGAAPPAPAPVVVGVHSAADDAAALDEAFADAARHGSGLVVVHARGRGETGRVEAATAPWREAHPQVRVDHVLAEGDPREALLHAARTGRLVVLGAHRHGGPARALLGSTTRDLLRLSPVPVAIVRPRARSRLLAGAATGDAGVS